MPLVDPFMPVRQPRRPQLSLSNARPLHPPRVIPASEPESRTHRNSLLTGSTSRRMTMQGQSGVPHPVQAQPKKQQKQMRKPRFSWRRVLMWLPAAIVLLVLVGTTGALVIGEVAIVLYGIAALILRIPSRTTFLLALLLLCSVPLLLGLVPGSGLAENCAVYAFLFLVVGTISLAVENRGVPSYSRRMSK